MSGDSNGGRVPASRHRRTDSCDMTSNRGRIRRWWPRKVQSGDTWGGYMANGWLTVIYIGPFTVIWSRER